jgi:hypothetical protein
MSSFTEWSVYIQPYKDKWRTCKNIRYYIEDSLEWEYIDIPAWFEFDWCSVFCPLWQSVEPDTITACAIHDLLFSTQQYSFIKTNLIFLNAMKINWVWFFKRYKYFIWVMTFWYFIWYYKKYLWKKKI